MAQQEILGNGSYSEHGFYEGDDATLRFGKEYAEATAAVINGGKPEITQAILESMKADLVDFFNAQQRAQGDAYTAPSANTLVHNADAYTDLYGLTPEQRTELLRYAQANINHFMPITYAYTGLIDMEAKDYIVGRADKGTRGYTPQPGFGHFPKLTEAQAAADGENEREGLNKREALLIVYSTM